MAPLTVVLYHHNYSICSIMVRYTFAIRGEPADTMKDIHFEEKEVDIFQNEQLSEHFLCEINKYGQVPVLTVPSSPKPIADSVDITYYLSTLYPSLIPAEIKDKIDELLIELHDLNYFSLSFPGREGVANGFKAAAEARLNGEISAKYREALRFKIGVLEKDKIGGLKPEVTAEMSQRARRLMEKFESTLGPQGPWLFGRETPTALDAHLVTFIMRMRDVSRIELIPESLQKYTDYAIGRPEWQGVVQGRQTMIKKE